MIFLAPALTFLSINLVVPAVRTILTSFLDRDSEEFVGLDNYEHLVTSETFLDWRSWSGDDGTWNILTSRLTWFGLFLIIAGIGIAYSINWTRNRTSASTTPRPLGPRWRSASSFWRSPSSR